MYQDGGCLSANQVLRLLVYGSAMPMFVKSKSTVSKAIQKLQSNPKRFIQSLASRPWAL